MRVLDVAISKQRDLGRDPADVELKSLGYATISSHAIGASDSVMIRIPSSSDPVDLRQGRANAPLHRRESFLLRRSDPQFDLSQLAPITAEEREHAIDSINRARGHPPLARAADGLDDAGRVHELPQPVLREE